MVGCKVLGVVLFVVAYDIDRWWGDINLNCHCQLQQFFENAQAYKLTLNFESAENLPFICSGVCNQQNNTVVPHGLTFVEPTQLHGRAATIVPREWKSV